MESGAVEVIQYASVGAAVNIFYLDRFLIPAKLNPVLLLSLKTTAGEVREDQTKCLTPQVFHRDA